jgi:hypothetical protein
VHEPELVMAEMAAQLEVPILPGQPLAPALIRWLDRFPLLLVLANFEHLLRAANRLNHLLDGSDKLKLLVTSQAQDRPRQKPSVGVSVVSSSQHRDHPSWTGIAQAPFSR